MDSDIDPAHSPSGCPATEDALPPRPPSVCQSCWMGPIAAYSRLLYRYASTPGDQDSDVPQQDWSYSTSLKRLKKSAATGCVLCDALCQEHFSPSMETTDQASSWERPITVTLSLFASRPPGTLQIEPTLDIDVDSSGRPSKWALQTPAYNPAAPYVRAQIPVLDVRSSCAFSLAKARIRECARDHAICSEISPFPNATVRLPTRVVDCTDPAHPRLVSTEGTLGMYLALSYVWGEAQPHQTTTANIATRYSAGMDATLLPPTIRHAIYATHALGFEYLWVDSLCIVQDSSEDKIHEVGRMHLVYRYAFVTIDAASAKRVGEGFLQERPEPPGITLPFICPPDPTRQGCQRLIGSVRLAAQKSRMCEPDYTTGMRGWCLQEYLMSPRSLIFTTDTVWFRCQTACTNVLGTMYYILSGTLGSGENRRLPVTLFHPDPPLAKHGSDAWRELHRAWWGVVVDYSRRALSEPSDKLVACGAVAAVFHRGLRSDYLAGLWGGPALLLDLLWQNASIDPSLTARPKAYRAPSWSWAAVEESVSPLWLRFDSFTTVAEVLDCAVELKDPELPFGQVASGFVVLHAALVTCTPRRHAAGLRLDTKLDADAVRSGRTWLVPILAFDSRSWKGIISGVAGLVVMIAGRNKTGSQDGRGKVYRRIGVFSEDSPRDAWQLKPLVEITLV